MRNSLLYKLSYHRYGKVFTDTGKPSGYDRVRRAEIGVKDIKLSTMEEVHTSKHWLVRVYRVRSRGNRDESKADTP